jgi:hypothetical protein
MKSFMVPKVGHQLFNLIVLIFYLSQKDKLVKQIQTN